MRHPILSYTKIVIAIEYVGNIYNLFILRTLSFLLMYVLLSSYLTYAIYLLFYFLSLSNILRASFS